jgi:hypothetical protein
MENWSPPDHHGIRTLVKDIGAVSTLRGRRLRRADFPDPKPVLLWPEQWRVLLRKWVRGAANRRHWKTLINEAGRLQIHTAFDLLTALLEAGWVEVEESRNRGVWDTIAVEFQNMENLRELLGLPNRAQLQEAFAGLSGNFQSGDIRLAYSSLATFAPDKAVKRHELLNALDAWIDERRSGTRRDFALFARGDTKGVTTSEWSWLAEVLDLEKHGVSQHTPALWFQAPLSLIFPEGEMNLRPLGNMLALPPAAILAAHQVKGDLSCWRVLENRTSFERVVKQAGPEEGVLWVPGFAPSWWLSAVDHLIELCPAPLYIASDPDPAGVMIATIVARVWGNRSLHWQPWGMSPEIVEKLPQQKPLSERDKQIIEDLLATDSLCLELKRLVLWMQESGMKAEQEGIPFEEILK